MKKFIAIVMITLFTSVYFAPVVNAVVSVGGETHICAETGKVCKDKKMCMKKKRPKKYGGTHAETAHHEAAASGHHDNHKKEETPKHKSCTERLSCGGGTGTVNMTSERLTFDESLISASTSEPLVFSKDVSLHKEGVIFNDAYTSTPERPPEVS